MNRLIRHPLARALPYFKGSERFHTTSARTGHSFAPDAPFGMTGSEVEPTMFVGQTEPTRSLRIADIRGFECSSAGSLRERQLLMGLS
jgi:hypothetical protein